MNATEVNAALDEAGGKVDEAARTLGVSRRILDRWITNNGLRGSLRERHPRRHGGGCPLGARKRTKAPRIVGLEAGPRVRVERECEAGGDFISLADSCGTMVTIKFPACGGGSARGNGRGRLAELIERPDGKSQTEFVVAEITVSSAEERKRIARLKSAISKVCGPTMAARVTQEAERIDE